MTLENKMKQTKIKAQEDRIVETYGKMREQTTLLEETKLKLKSISLINLLLPILTLNIIFLSTS